jgi:Ca2+:H+ antiporter
MRYFYWLSCVAIALAFLGHYVLWPGRSFEPILTFALAGLGVIPMARLMGQATEQLSQRVGPTAGGLLNATFGNAAELIIALIALSKGLNEMVKASLIGSILGNLLLVAGGAMVVGGARRQRQTFSALAAETSSGLLALAVGTMLIPAIFHHTAEVQHDPLQPQHELAVSIGAGIVLLLVYALGLLFTLHTHAHVFSPPVAESPEEKPGISALHPPWSVRRSVIALFIAAVIIAFLAELLVGAAEPTAARLGWNHIFIGVILLAIIGNAAEHATAVTLAYRDDMDTAMAITYQSSLQIALFVTPLLVLASIVMVAMGMPQAHHLDMVFSNMEVVAVVLTVFIVVVIGINGETNWYEGVMLLALYAILAIAFFYMPGGAAP